MLKRLKTVNFSQYQYVAVNLLISLLTFGRNILFMSTLGLVELGQVALMQTIVMLIGFLQGGAINGAFILYASKDAERNSKLVNILFWGAIFLLAVVFLFASLFILLGGEAFFASEIYLVTLVIGLSSGVASLMSTWMNNALVAEGALRKSNIVGLVAIVISLVVAYLSSMFGLEAALLSMLLQPLVMIIMAMTLDRGLVPKSLRIDKTLLKQVFVLGRLPFLGGLLILSSYQVERWAILFSLGAESLGRYYLVMMYMAFFVLIPTSLLNIHFPKALRAYEKNDFDLFKSISSRHLIELGVYCVIALILTATCMPFIVDLFLPQFSGSVNLVYIVFPAMLLFVMRDSAALVLYSIKEMRPILISSALFLSIYFSLTATAVFFEFYSLDVSVLLRGISILVPTLYLFAVRNNVMKRFA